MRALKIVLLLLIFAVLEIPRAPFSPQCENCGITITDLMPTLRANGLPDLGRLRLVGAWQLSSANRDFGNFSGLAQLDDGTMVAPGDRNGFMWFKRPDLPGPWHVRLGRPFKGDWRREQVYSDAEAIMVDQVHRNMLLVYEDVPLMFRFNTDLSHRKKVRVPALQEWVDREANKGPEATARLADKRVVMVGELYDRMFNRRLHPAFVFADDAHFAQPPGRFSVEMPEGFRPTEMAQMPDGRVLLLGRKLTLMGFRSVIVIAEAADFRAGAIVHPREIARIVDPRVRDNYEGMTVTTEPDGSYAVWVISGSNLMAWAQRTLLLKLRLDPGAIAPR